MNMEDIPDLENKCFLPIFRQNLAQMNQSGLSQFESTWIAGVHILKNYYVVYDMDTSTSVNILGIERRNSEDRIGMSDDPEEVDWIKKYMDLVIAIIVFSLACLLLICFYNYRKAKREKHNDLLMTEANSDDDDSFSIKNMLKTGSSEQKWKIKPAGYKTKSPRSSMKKSALKVNYSEVSGMSSPTNNRTS